MERRPYESFCKFSLMHRTDFIFVHIFMVDLKGVRGQLLWFIQLPIRQKNDGEREESVIHYDRERNSFTSTSSLVLLFFWFRVIMFCIYYQQQRKLLVQQFVHTVYHISFEYYYILDVSLLPLIHKNKRVRLKAILNTLHTSQSKTLQKRKTVENPLNHQCADKSCSPIQRGRIFHITWCFHSFQWALFWQDPTQVPFLLPASVLL